MNERGVTLTSLIVYIIGLTIVVGVIATLTSFFYKNMEIENINDDSTIQYTKFSNIFLKEINRENNYVIDSRTTNNEEKISYIIFASGNQYTYRSINHSIYKNNIKICDNVIDCDFNYTLIDSKYNIKVNFKTNNIDLTGENAITYIL